MGRMRHYWSPDEERLIERLFHDGLNDTQIAERLPGRTRAAISFRRSRLRLARERKNYAKPTRNSAKEYLSRGNASASVEAPPEAVAERDRVYAAPRTIHMVLLGDPPPGRSALDQKRAAASEENSIPKLSSRHPAWSPQAW
jgi:hypothetical protein